MSRFKVPYRVFNHIGCNKYDDSIEIRSNKFFIDYINEFNNGEYRIVKLPDETTDFHIFSDNGLEYVYYVINGKMIKI